MLKVIDVAKLLGYGFNKEAPLLSTEPSGLMDGYDKQRHEKRASMASPVNFDVQYDEKRDDGECEMSKLPETDYNDSHNSIEFNSVNQREPPRSINSGISDFFSNFGSLDSTTQMLK